MRCPRRGPLEAARRDLCAAGVLGPGPRHVHPRGEEASGNRCGVCPPSHTTGPGVRPDVHSDRTAEGQTSVLRPDPSCLCRRTPPSLLVSSALPLTDVEGNGGRDPRQEVSAGTLPVSVELPARYEDYSLARKKASSGIQFNPRLCGTGFDLHRAGLEMAPVPWSKADFLCQAKKRHRQRLLVTS